MDSAEKAALRSLQDDLFNARADAAHERECVVEALRILRGALNAATSPRSPNEKVNDLCRIVDEASTALNRERKK